MTEIEGANGRRESLEDSPRAVAPAAAGLSAPLTGAAIIVVAWALLHLWGIGSTPFHTKGEPREALVVWEMTHGGSWVLPRRNGSELPSKPPLFHWLGAVTSLAAGRTDEGTIRFPSAILSLAGALMVWAAGRSLWSGRAGVAAALVLLTSFEWARAATSARVDMTLTVAIEAALLSFLFFLRTLRRGWLVPCYLGMAAAVLGKGPVGAILPAIVCVAAIVTSRRFTALLRLRLPIGIAAVLILGGSWYLLAYHAGGEAFFRKQILDENIYRMLGSSQLSGGHRHGISYLLGGLLLGLLPWTLALPSTAAELWHKRREITLVGGPWYFVLWIAVVIGFYALPASKRSVYLLALYPAAALLIGWWWEQCRSAAAAKAGRLFWKLVAALILVLIATVALVLLFDRTVHLLDLLNTVLSERDRAATLSAITAIRRNGVAIALLIGAATAGALGIWRGSDHRIPGVLPGLVVVAASMLLLVRQIALPAIAEVQTARPLMQRIASYRDPGHGLFFYGSFDYGAVFYAQRHIPRFEGRGLEDGPRYLLISPGEWLQLRAAAIHRYRVATDSEGPLGNDRLVLIERVDA